VQLITWLGSVDATSRRNACRRLLAYVLSDLDALPSRGETVHNPPEEARRYSSVHNGNSVGTGHARSTLNSKQAWSAQKNDTAQWVTIDAGEAGALVAGVVVQGRGHSCRAQCVTKLTVCVSSDGSSFSEVDAGRIFETGCVADDDTQQRVHFGAPVRGRFFRLQPAAWNRHISMRCGLLLAPAGPPGAEAASIPIICLLDDSVCASAPRSINAASGEDELLLDLEADPSGALLQSCGKELLSQPHRFAEDMDGATLSCARLLWPYREGLLVRAFSPADAVAAVLPQDWRDQPVVRGWAQAVDSDWLHKLWAAIDRFARFGGETATQMLDKLASWPLIPCGDELVLLVATHSI